VRGQPARSAGDATRSSSPGLRPTSPQGEVMNGAGAYIPSPGERVRVRGQPARSAGDAARGSSPGLWPTSPQGEVMNEAGAYIPSPRGEG
jgi:hypothetical protein